MKPQKQRPVLLKSAIHKISKIIIGRHKGIVKFVENVIEGVRSNKCTNIGDVTTMGEHAPTK